MFVSLRMYRFSILVTREYLGLVLLGVQDEVFVVVVVDLGVHVFDQVVAVFEVFAVVEQLADAVDELLPAAVEFHLY